MRWRHISFLYPQSLAFSRKVQAQPILREAAMLGYGTMVAKYCAETPTCPAELVKVRTKIVTN